VEVSRDEQLLRRGLLIQPGDIIFLEPTVIVGGGGASDGGASDGGASDCGAGDGRTVPQRKASQIVAAFNRMRNSVSILFNHPADGVIAADLATATKKAGGSGDEGGDGQADGGGASEEMGDANPAHPTDPEPPTPAVWSCGGCTLENEPAASRCAVCGADKPGPLTSAKVDGNGPPKPTVAAASSITSDVFRYLVQLDNRKTLAEAKQAMVEIINNDITASRASNVNGEGECGGSGGGDYDDGTNKDRRSNEVPLQGRSGPEAAAMLVVSVHFSCHLFLLVFILIRDMRSALGWCATSFLRRPAQIIFAVVAAQEIPTTPLAIHTFAVGNNITKSRAHH
jgi:hypothetical protein